MRAILLCAGFGTRLYPLTRHRPKPLLPLGGKPVVEHLVAQLAGLGITEVAFVSNHRFIEPFLTFRSELAERYRDVRFEVLDDGATGEEDRRGAVADLALAVSAKGAAATALVAAGDNVFTGGLERFLADYRARPRNLVARYRETDPERLRRTGVAEIDPEGRILKFWEKPSELRSEWACPALYLLEPPALGWLEPYRQEADDVDNLGSFVAWLSAREPVFTHELEGRRLDIGDRRSYEEAERYFV